MNKGDRIRVYQCPYTREQFEEEATLVARSAWGTDTPWERWTVQFDGEDGTYDRIVSPDDIVTGRQLLMKTWQRAHDWQDQITASSTNRDETLGELCKILCDVGSALEANGKVSARGAGWHHSADCICTCNAGRFQVVSPAVLGFVRAAVREALEREDRR